MAHPSRGPLLLVSVLPRSIRALASRRYIAGAKIGFRAVATARLCEEDIPFDVGPFRCPSTTLASDRIAARPADDGTGGRTHRNRLMWSIIALAFLHDEVEGSPP